VSRLTDQHFAGLLGVRSAIAVFERTGEREARSAGATHAQHHVLLALRGHRDRQDAPTVKDVAAALGVASPSAVELIGRMVGAGLLERRPDGRDARLTRLHLTGLGQRLVTELSEGHLPRLRELTRRGVELIALVERRVRARDGGTSRRSTVRVSAIPSRRLAAAEGWVLSSSRASTLSSASASNAERAW